MFFKLYRRRPRAMHRRPPGSLRPGCRGNTLRIFLHPFAFLLQPHILRVMSRSLAVLRLSCHVSAEDVVVVIAFYGNLEKTNLRIIYFPPLGHPLAHHRQGKDLFLKRYGFSRMIVMDLYLFYDFKRLRSIQ